MLPLRCCSEQAPQGKGNWDFPFESVLSLLARSGRGHGTGNHFVLPGNSPLWRCSAAEQRAARTKPRHAAALLPQPQLLSPHSSPKKPLTPTRWGEQGADPTAGTQLQAPAPGAREGLESPLPKGPCSVVSSPVLENLIFQAKKGKKIGQETDAISPAEGEAEAWSSSAFSPSPKQTTGSPAAAW